MEYLEGQTLQALTSRLAARHEGLSDTLAAYAVAQGLKGIHHAHELCDFDGSALGIVHRDVSPHNIYITYGGEVKVLDFGIAKATSNASHTETGILKGKIRYMAPEHVGELEVDCRADVFAFGVVLWELLAKRPLFQGEAASVMLRIINDDAPSPFSVRPDVAPELDDIVRRALRRERDERDAPAHAMREALEAYLTAKGAASAEKELGLLMTSTFSEVRDQVRTRIKRVLDRPPGAAVGDGARGLPSQRAPFLFSTRAAHPAASGDTVVPMVMPSQRPRWRGSRARRRGFGGQRRRGGLARPPGPRCRRFVRRHGPGGASARTRAARHPTLGCPRRAGRSTAGANPGRVRRRTRHAIDAGEPRRLRDGEHRDGGQARRVD